jgi:hypothetical protein
MSHSLPLSSPFLCFQSEFRQLHCSYKIRYKSEENITVAHFFFYSRQQLVIHQRHVHSKNYDKDVGIGL